MGRHCGSGTLFSSAFCEGDRTFFLSDQWALHVGQCAAHGLSITGARAHGTCAAPHLLCPWPHRYQNVVPPMRLGYLSSNVGAGGAVHAAAHNLRHALQKRRAVQQGVLPGFGGMGCALAARASRPPLIQCVELSS